jgi:hypothetical protein
MWQDGWFPGRRSVGGVSCLFNGIWDTRPLSAEETQQRITTKANILGLASVRRTQLRQRSQLTWIEAGDANTSSSNGRRSKNFIPALTHRGTTYMGR